MMYIIYLNYDKKRCVIYMKDHSFIEASWKLWDVAGLPKHVAQG